MSAALSPSPFPFTIKVCGLTRKEDVLAAVEAGADAVGFVLVGDREKSTPTRRAFWLCLCRRKAA